MPRIAISRRLASRTSPMKKRNSRLPNSRSRLACISYCFSSSREKTTRRRARYRRKTVRTNCWPKEPVPPVTRMLLLLKSIAFCISISMLCFVISVGRVEIVGPADVDPVFVNGEEADLQAGRAAKIEKLRHVDARLGWNKSTEFRPQHINAGGDEISECRLLVDPLENSLLILPDHAIWHRHSIRRDGDRSVMTVRVVIVIESAEVELCQHIAIDDKNRPIDLPRQQRKRACRAERNLLADHCRPAGSGAAVEVGLDALGEIMGRDIEIADPTLFEARKDVPEDRVFFFRR